MKMTMVNSGFKGLRLGQRRRRWTSIKTTLAQRLVAAGLPLKLLLYNHRTKCSNPTCFFVTLCTSCTCKSYQHERLWEHFTFHMMCMADSLLDEDDHVYCKSFYKHLIELKLELFYIYVHLTDKLYHCIAHEYKGQYCFWATRENTCI